MYESENPIAIQSQKWIVDSLLKLMKEKPFRQITIQEIAVQAQLDRRTFYRNFQSKEDVLYCYIKSLGDEYVVALLNKDKITIPICLRVFFEVAEKYKAFIIQLRDNNLLMFLLNGLNELLPSIHSLVESKFMEYPDNGEGDIEYVFAFNIGGFWNILIKWINEEFIKTPQEISEIVNSLMGKMLV